MDSKVIMESQDGSRQGSHKSSIAVRLLYKKKDTKAQGEEVIRARSQWGKDAEMRNGKEKT